MKARANLEGWVYIVRRESDGKYLTARSTWHDDSLNARPFGNKGHAKTSLQSMKRYSSSIWIYGDVYVLIPCELVLLQSDACERYTVPA